MKNNYINFVLTGDNNYVAPLGVCMTSILLNLAEDRFARFYLFVEGFSNDDMRRLEDIKKVRPCEIIFINMDEYTHLFSFIDTSKFVLQYVNLVVYYRLLMLEILPEDIDKCFYIDGDMIIDSDLSYLYDNFDEKNVIGAVVEILAMQYRNDILKHFLEWEELKSFHNNPIKRPYFNAGFFLLNVKKAKELKLFQKAFEFLDKHPNPPYADQDTLNYIIGQAYPHLVQHFPPSYNVFCDMHHDIDLYYDAFYSQQDIQEAFDNPKIYHYGGANKPWINRNVRFFYSVWWRYCHLSPWSELKEPEESNSEEKLGNLHILDEQMNENLISHPNNISLTYKFLNIVPVFIKKVKNQEKKYYVLGVKVFSKRQKTPYLKLYRFLGFKYKKINLQKMYEFRIEDVKNLINWHFQESNNKADCQFEQLNQSTNYKFEELTDKIHSQFEQLNQSTNYKFEELTDKIHCQFEQLNQSTNYKFEELTDKIHSQFKQHKKSTNYKLEESMDKIHFQLEQLKRSTNYKFEELTDKIHSQIIELKKNMLIESDRLTKEVESGVQHSEKNFSSLNENLKQGFDSLFNTNLETKSNLDISLQDLKKNVGIINSVFDTHQKTFLPYKNIFEGKDIAILATGSSLKNYDPIPNVIHIGVNNAYKFDKVVLDFLFIQDISGLKQEIMSINNYGIKTCQKFYGDVLTIDTSAIPESYLIKYNAKRYYTGGMFSPFVRDISSCLLPDFGSVVFASLAFALYTNPRKIYLVGCDCSETGYFYNDALEISSSLKGDLTNIIKGWQNFKLFANHHYPDTKIISINPVGLKGMFEDIQME